MTVLAQRFEVPLWAFLPMPPLELAQVYEAQASFVWRSLKRLGVREADLEDVTQEVFVVVHRKLSGFDGRSALKTWLFGIAMRVASDYRRRAHVQREDIMAEVPEGESHPDAPDRIAQKQARAVLDSILDGLDEEKRATFVLFELEQLSMAEVAELTQVPVQTAYARLYAARRIVEEAVALRQKVSA